MQIIPEEEPKKYQPAPEETVAGTMKGLLSSGSSYLEAAKTRGTQFAAQRGLLNTTMAAGASEAEAIKSALPIAQQDAGYMQNRGLETQRGEIQTGLYRTQGEISGGLLAQEGEQAKELSAQESGQTLGRETALTAQKGTIQSELTAQEAAAKAALSTQEAGQAITLENIQQEGANYRLGLENDLKTKLAEMELSSQEKTSVGNAMTDMGVQFSEELTNIQRDPNVSAANKTRTIRTLQAAYQSNLMSLANIYSVELTWQPVV